MDAWAAWKALTVSTCVLGAIMVVCVLSGWWGGPHAATKDDFWLHQTQVQAKESCKTEWRPYAPLPKRTPETLWEHRRDAYCLLYGEAPK